MRNILIVEDDPSLAQVLKLLLEQLDCSVHCAANGYDALERLSAPGGEPDIILTDLCLPGMDGQQLLNSVRQSHPRLPVVIITGLAPERNPPSSDALPDAVLQKPVGMAELKGILERFGL